VPVDRGDTRLGTQSEPVEADGSRLEMRVHSCD
jgi:hypothetical protein